MKRMKHPLHGFHHAYSPQEEATLRAGGWVDDVPVMTFDQTSQFIAQVVSDAKTNELPSVVATAATIQRRPGRPRKV